MKNDLQYSIIEALQQSLIDCSFPAVEVMLDLPGDSRFGDFSSNVAMQLAKTAKRSPRDVAGLIVEALRKRIAVGELKDMVKEVKIEGAGFINFYLSERYFYSQLQGVLDEGKEYLRSSIGAGKRVMIEFVSANPTGPLSVAHARQAAVGDSLANVLEFIGFKVEREYYLNDEGNQINILGRSVEARMKELAGEKIEFPENYYQGEYIYDIAKAVSLEPMPVGDVGDYAGNYILRGIEDELASFGVKFDCWYSQKSLRKSGKIDEAFKALKAKGYLFEEEGALWFKSTAFGDDKDRVVIKSDGSLTYLAPDIAYHEEKFKRGFEWLINLWGPDHHGYIPRLKASVQAFGHAADSLSVVIVQLATIFRDGKTVEMSTRRGQYITLREVLDEVGRDASRFFFLMRRTSSHLDFDLEVAKKHTSENPVYYVQYAHARIASILRSAQVERKGADLSRLLADEEFALMKKIVQFSSILNICLSTQDSYMVTVYLQSLAETFHKFYDKQRVLTDDVELTRARLCLIEGTKIVIATGLDLLGVSSPESM